MKESMQIVTTTTISRGEHAKTKLIKLKKKT